MRLDVLFDPALHKTTTKDRTLVAMFFLD